MNTTSLQLKAIEPTVFFVQTAQGLRQAVDLVIWNAAEAVDGGVAVKFGSQEEHVEIGKIVPGEGKYRAYIPDIRESVPVEFVLLADGKVRDRYSIMWMPQRHWQVYMIPIAHHDFGYTDTIENVLHRYDGFYDDILRFCEETEDWPEESKFRYTAEQSWSIQHYIENRPKQTVEKIVKYMREGRIEVPALFGNEISALCSHEELIRLPMRLTLKKKATILSSLTRFPFKGRMWYGYPVLLWKALLTSSMKKQERRFLTRLSSLTAPRRLYRMQLLGMPEGNLIARSFSIWFSWQRMFLPWATKPIALRQKKRLLLSQAP